MRAASQIYRIHPARGVAWTPQTSVTDIAVRWGRALRRWKRHSTAWRTGVCVISGHERWTTRSGDWTCMRCGKVKRLEVPNFPASPETTALPRFNS